MQVEPPFRIDAAPLTAALVLFATLFVGSVGGFAVGLGARAAEAPSAVAPAVVSPRDAANPSTLNGRYYADEGEICRWGPALECLAPGH
jgi:hypothetical protein